MDVRRREKTMTTPASFDRLALEICSREPIHIPGAIQPHGALLVLEDGSFQVLQVSANLEAVCGWTQDTILRVNFVELAADDSELLHHAVLAEDPLLVSPVTIS